MKEIELSKLDMTLYYDKLKNGLEVYLLPYDNKNNYYMSYATRYGSETTIFTPAGEETEVSVPNKLDNLLLIRAGIDRYNFNKTMEIIEKDLKDMQKGKFKESDISVAKELFNTAIDETLESQSRIIDNYLMMEFIGTDDLDKKRELMNKVTKKEIVNVAKKVKIDIVFLLEGGK